MLTAASAWVLNCWAVSCALATTWLRVASIFGVISVPASCKRVRNFAVSSTMVRKLRSPTAYFFNGENWFERMKYLKKFEYSMKHMNRFFVLTRNFSASPLNNSGFLAFNSSVTCVTWVVNSLTKSWAFACNGLLCRNKKKYLHNNSEEMGKIK